MTLVSAFTTATADQRIVSPLFCGSHPYLHGSLTYRLFSKYHYQSSLSMEQLLKKYTYLSLLVV